MNEFRLQVVEESTNEVDIDVQLQPLDFPHIYINVRLQDGKLVISAEANNEESTKLGEITVKL